MPNTRPVDLRWRLQTSASLDRAWALLSDTDRFNRVAGVTQRFEEEPQQDGTVRRTGTMRRAGIKLRWREHPFEWRAPQRFAVRRVFDGGPASEYVLRLTLEQRPDGGTDIDYHVAIQPRMTLTRPAVLADAKLFTRPGLERALNRAVAVLDGREQRFDDPPPPLDAKAAARLDAGLAELRSRAVAERLGRWLRSAPLHVQQRIKPLALARRWGLPEAEVIAGFVDAVGAGVLTLSWELRCPSCRVPKARAPRLGAGPRDVHCPSCNLPFDGSLPDNLIVGFSPDPAIRHIDEPVRCIGSPGRTPHLLTQLALEPMAESFVELPLLPGAYRLRTFPATSTVSLQVRPDVVGRVVTVQARHGQLSPGLVRAAPGRVRIDVRSLIDLPMTLVLERPHAPSDELTAGRLLEFDAAREAIPETLLHPDLNVDVGRNVVLATRLVRGGQQARDALVAALEPWLPEAVLARTDTVVATFGDARTALKAAGLLDGAHHVGAGVSVGPVVRRRQGDRVSPCGATVDRALELADAGQGGAVLVEPQDATEPELATHLREDGVSVHDTSEGHLRVRLEHPVRTTPPLRYAPPRVEPAAGMAIDGRFLLRETLGGGGFGTAWLAADEQGEEVVVKLLHPRLAEQPVQVQRFFNEGRLVRDLDTPYIARVIDYGRGREGHLYVAMERLHGEELWTLLKRAGTLEPKRTLGFVIDVLRGLEVAHAAGVVHRDLKPANILICADGKGGQVARIIDFGVARELDSTDPRLTTDGHAIGTPHYMAPEQVEGHAVDGRTDLYALASVLYECLSGRLPFEGDHSIALLLARVREPPRPISDVIALPAALAMSIMGALSKDPAKRPADAATWRAELEHLRAHLDVLDTSGMAVTSIAEQDTLDFTPARGTHGNE